jgi:hypothetical protein
MGNFGSRKKPPVHPWFQRALEFPDALQVSRSPSRNDFLPMIVAFGAVHGGLSENSSFPVSLGFYTSD